MVLVILLGSVLTHHVIHDVRDGELLLVDVGGVSTSGDSGHGGKVAAVASHDFLESREHCC